MTLYEVYEGCNIEIEEVTFPIRLLTTKLVRFDIVIEMD